MKVEFVTETREAFNARRSCRQPGSNNAAVAISFAGEIWAPFRSLECACDANAGHFPASMLPLTLSTLLCACYCSLEAEKIR